MPPRTKIGDQAQEPREKQLHEVIADAVGDGLVKAPSFLKEPM